MTSFTSAWKRPENSRPLRCAHCSRITVASTTAPSSSANVTAWLVSHGGVAAGAGGVGSDHACPDITADPSIIHAMVARVFIWKSTGGPQSDCTQKIASRERSVQDQVIEWPR